MKIATWNLQRLDKRKNDEILSKLEGLEADIIILTETNEVIQLNGYTFIGTEPLPAQFDGIKYKTGENRVSILTKYKTTTRYQTYDKYTAVCTDIETPFGFLTVYGSIIGVFGNKQPKFDNDLYGQLADFEKLIPGRNCCIAGDFNVTFSGRVYPSRKAREVLVVAFKELELNITTAAIENNVDHIVLGDVFLQGKQISLETWNTDKKLSDHIGVSVTLHS